MGNEFLSGTLSTIILAMLKENGKMYGYEICNLVKSKTEGGITLTEGAIYPSLHKLEKKGTIISSKEKVNGRIRKYYELNKELEADVAFQIKHLDQFLKNLSKLLNLSKA
jgi:DNA-binding PadR family transcriptional regulator